ncbi:MAG: alpha/beta hydrolase [Sulfurospirillaceae bacterium]|nr:alpha/beta hydrolase [Sulfurospirillaceae bacterium]
MKKIYVIHGFFASPYDHWFPWLHDKMQMAHGLDVEILHMPTQETPYVDEWLDKIHHMIGTPDINTFVITHSLGGIALLRYLNNLQESFLLGGIILVSPFDKPIDVYPLLDSFVNVTLDYAKLSRNIDQKAVIISGNDAFVSPTISKALSQKLDCALFEIPRGGHFLGKEGFEMFPEVYEILKKMLTKH